MFFSSSASSYASSSASSASSASSSYNSSYGSYSAVDHEKAMPSKSEHIQSSCAFPSWPRRESLGGFTTGAGANSYISDEDLFPDSLDSDSASATSTPCRSPQLLAQNPRFQNNVEIDLWASAAAVRAENQARKTQRRYSKKSSKPSSKTMSPILEAE